MRKFFVLFLAFSMIPWAAGSRSGSITMEFDLSDHPSDEATQLWIPSPVVNIQR